MRMCPDKETLSAYLDGEIDLPWRGRLEKHLEGCAACREYLDSLARLGERLRADAEPDSGPSLARLRPALAARSRQPAPRSAPIWRRRISLPLPLAAVAGLAILCLAAGLLVSILNPREIVPRMSIKRLPYGATEVEVAAPIEDLEKLLRSLDQPAFTEEIIFTLPEDSRFIMAGEPRMLRAADVPRRRSW
jgi:negative regulator of sigma E activity